MKKVNYCTTTPLTPDAIKAFWAEHAERKRREPDVIHDYSHIPAEERVGLLIGGLVGLLAPCRQLAKELSIRKGAVQSRVDLGALIDTVTALCLSVDKLQMLTSDTMYAAEVAKQNMVEAAKEAAGYYDN